LKDDDHEVRERAVVALARIGPPAREAVPILLRATLPVGLTVYGLRQIDPKGQQTIPAALALLKETQPLLRRKAAFALLVFDKSKSRLAIADFVAALKRKGNEVNSAGHWGNEIPACNMLSEIAAWALGEIGLEAREAVPALVEALRSPPNLPQLGSGFPSAEPYESALKCVDPEGKEAIPLLMKVLSAKGSENRKDMDEWCRVIRALAQYGPRAKAAIPALRAIVKNTEKFAGPSGDRRVTELHDAAVEALKKIDPTTTPSKPVKKGNDS
jgi:HEAT repeat protein